MTQRLPGTPVTASCHYHPLELLDEIAGLGFQPGLNKTETVIVSVVHRALILENHPPGQRED
ncbi:MAG TPA: hypothetical protein VIO35_10400 [Chloroflexota bacterium]